MNGETTTSFASVGDDGDWGTKKEETFVLTVASDDLCAADSDDDLEYADKMLRMEFAGEGG